MTNTGQVSGNKTIGRWLDPRSRVFLIVSAQLTLLIYLAVAWIVLPPHAIWTPDEGGKLLQVQSLRFEDGRLDYRIEYVGQGLDPQLKFAEYGSRLVLRTHNEALYVRRLPLFPLMTLPLFKVLGFYGLYLIPAVTASVCGVLALLLIEEKHRRLGMWVLIAFGSPIFTYATLFSEHTLATLLGLAAAWFMLQGRPDHSEKRNEGLLRWVAIAVLLGISIFFRPEMLLFSLALLLAYWLLMPQNRWGPIVTAVGLVGALALYSFLHIIVFGQALPDHARYIFDTTGYLARAKWQVVPDLLLGPPVHGAVDSGWLGGLWAIGAVLAMAHSLGPTRSQTARTLQVVGLGLTAVAAAFLLFTPTSYRAAHGILFTTPWALVGLCRARDLWDKGSWRVRIIVLTVVFGLVAYVISALTLQLQPDGPHGTMEWGARYLLTFYPLLALMAAWDLGEKRSDLKILVVVAALMFLGIGFQLRGIWILRNDKGVNAAYNQALVQAASPNVVTDQWWLTLNGAPVHGEKAVFWARSPEKVADWVELAADQRIEDFTLVTFDLDMVDSASVVLDENELSVVGIDRVGALLFIQVEIGD